MTKQRSQFTMLLLRMCWWMKTVIVMDQCGSYELASHMRETWYKRLGRTEYAWHVSGPSMWVSGLIFSLPQSSLMPTDLATPKLNSPAVQLCLTGHLLLSPYRSSRHVSLLQRNRKMLIVFSGQRYSSLTTKEVPFPARSIFKYCKFRDNASSVGKLNIC